VDEASKYAALHETEQYGILQSIFACGAILLGANRMIDALRCFLAVVDTGNLSKAAKTLSLAVSSVSRKIDWLESELHGKLFHRSSRLVRLTDAGERFLPSARHIVAELAEAKAAVASVEIEPRGLITVTAPASFGRRHVAPAVAEFLRRYPLLELDLHVSDEIVDLASERIDVAIRIGVLPNSDLLATFLAPHRRIACASPAYLARHGTPATPQDLINHNCMKFVNRPAPPGWWCFPGVNRNKPITVRGSMRTDDIDTMLQAAIGGVGIVHLASWLVSDAIAAGQLVLLFGPTQQSRGHVEAAIHAVRMPGRSHPVKAKLFIEHLRDYFGAPPYWDSALLT